MPMPASRASRAERKRRSCPSSLRLPRSAGCTPAMIFISVLLPAPFSPTSPWISPRASVKSTPRNASTPPKDLEIWPRSGTGGGEAAPPPASGLGCSRATTPASDQVVALHPQHARRVGLGDHRPVGDDILGDAALACLLAVDQRRYARQDRAAVDAAGG